jgi:hypothetical protein
MLSHGSPSSGCVVNKYACAATRAASGVSGMILPTSSTVRNDELRFCMRYTFPGRSTLPLLCFGSWCLSSLDYGISLHSYHCVLFATLLDSWFILS